MESVVEVIAYLVLLAKEDLGKWGTILAIALIIATLGGIITTVFVLWS
jgi:choline-glycine betaine transporter